jgi:hypothetical protein
MTHSDTAPAARNGYGEHQPPGRGTESSVGRRAGAGRNEPDGSLGDTPAAGHRAAIDHPDWCDTASCTVTAATDVPGGLHGRSVTLRAGHGFPVPLTVTASLYQSAAFPAAGPYVVLELQGLDTVVRGLDSELQTVSGMTQIPAEHAVALGTALLDAAAGAVAGSTASGTPHAVVRNFEDVIDIVGRGGRVPLTFAEARDLEDQVSAILAVFDPQLRNRADSDVMSDVFFREYQQQEQRRSGGGHR